MKLAFDKKTARRVDENGYLHVDNSALTKAAVNPYYGHEIPNGELLGLDPNKVYQVLRPAEELEKAVSTFNGLPILIRHKEDSSFDPQRALRIGTTGTSAVWKAPYILNAIVFHDATAIYLIDTEEQKELSAGYRYDAVLKSGVFEGQPYDLIMTNIRGNHIALVKVGRAGPDVVVADSSPFLRGSIMSAKQKMKSLALAISAAVTGKETPMAQDAAAEVIEDMLGAMAAEEQATKDADPMTGIEARVGRIEELLTKLLAHETTEVEDAEPETPPAEGAEKPPAEDALPEGEKPTEPKEKLAGDSAMRAKKPVMALDAAQIAAEVTAAVTKKFHEKEQAIEAVRPIVGAVISTAFDSAESVYAFALKQRGLDPENFPKEAYSGMCAVLVAQPGGGAKPLIAEDAAPSGVMADIDLSRFGQLN